MAGVAVFVVAVLAVIVVAALWGTSVVPDGPTANSGITARADGTARQAGSADIAPASTPISEWRAGEMPYLYQTDTAWASEPYAGGTVAKNGCGPTCVTMADVYLTGRADLTPADMCARAEAGGWFYDGMTTWTYMTEGVAQLGLVGEEQPADAGVLRSLLAAGTPIICSMRPGDFTKSGHFILLAGLDGDGDVIVRDPNSEQRSHQTWDLQRVINQCANIWSMRLA